MEASGVISTGQSPSRKGRDVTLPSESSYRTIPLSQGQFAIVDAADYEWLNQWKWYAAWRKSIKSFYAARMEKKTRLVLMHREILGLSKGDKREGDHVESALTLDNRRSNLRVASHAQNSQNKGLQANNKSGFKGVSWAKRQKKWTAHIGANGKHKNLGYFADPEEAHDAYCAAAKALHGEFTNAG